MGDAISGENDSQGSANAPCIVEQRPVALPQIINEQQVPTPAIVVGPAQSANVQMQLNQCYQAQSLGQPMEALPNTYAVTLPPPPPPQLQNLPVSEVVTLPPPPPIIQGQVYVPPPPPPFIVGERVMPIQAPKIASGVGQIPAQNTGQCLNCGIQINSQKNADQCKSCQKCTGCGLKFHRGSSCASQIKLVRGASRAVRNIGTSEETEDAKAFRFASQCVNSLSTNQNIRVRGVQICSHEYFDKRYRHRMRTQQLNEITCYLPIANRDAQANLIRSGLKLDQRTKAICFSKAKPDLRQNVTIALVKVAVKGQPLAIEQFDAQFFGSDQSLIKVFEDASAIWCTDLSYCQLYCLVEI